MVPEDFSALEHDRRFCGICDLFKFAGLDAGSNQNNCVVCNVKVVRLDEIYLTYFRSVINRETCFSNLSISFWPIQPGVLTDIALCLGSIGTTENTHSVQMKHQVFTFGFIFLHWHEAVVNYARL